MEFCVRAWIELSFIVVRSRLASWLHSLTRLTPSFICGPSPAATPA